MEGRERGESRKGKMREENEGQREAGKEGGDTKCIMYTQSLNGALKCSWALKCLRLLNVLGLLNIGALKCFGALKCWSY